MGSSLHQAQGGHRAPHEPTLMESIIVILSPRPACLDWVATIVSSALMFAVLSTAEASCCTVASRPLSQRWWDVIRCCCANSRSSRANWASHGASCSDRPLQPSPKMTPAAWPIALKAEG
eukprot:CAMPEP_0195066902 /NCGR_PEP_ID=MMETSP0448-20130528/12136_1 /TAXON_ID=66468 /ORGANISM="Heterocapsa triquestra, Strain CCMP 448" /LENGTH=119 /DNA_ID=CAMNT_0040098235 /DNA_START=259 /DNA_END=618 /DNA_ORIENTATION=+